MSAREVAEAAQLACLLEASAPKPGNVSPGRHFADVRFEHFLASAIAIGEPMTEAGVRPLGQTIRLAIEATSRWAPSNTNLGIVLLLAPLVRAAILGSERGQSGVKSRLRETLARVLDATTVADAREVYAAIRLARPGGLGQAHSQDVADEPTVTLLEAMRLAAERDGIAREYSTSFETTFTIGVPALRSARCAGLSWDDAVVETFLRVLAAAPDTHIVRRAGHEIAADVSRSARSVLDAGGVRSEDGRRALAEMHDAMRDERLPAGAPSAKPGNIANPGTSADLTAAAIFVELLDGGLG